MTNTSRGTLYGSCVAGNWGLLVRLGDFYADPAYFYHHIAARLEPDINNQAGILVKVQESEDFNVVTNTGTWVDRLKLAATLVPGGEYYLNTFHVRRFVQIIFYSAHDAILRGTWLVDEDQTLPHFEHSGNELTCSSFCECDCETGSETAD